ncbi:hypothetical protein EDB83DRAFT_2316623 [Lactarius deliciosus]|nr:hypothetical protein EDB83DRAFT_2316623 [Lactarius deliciosus]
MVVGAVSTWHHDADEVDRVRWGGVNVATCSWHVGCVLGWAAQRAASWQDSVLWWQGFHMAGSMVLCDRLQCIKEWSDHHGLACGKVEPMETCGVKRGGTPRMCWAEVLEVQQRVVRNEIEMKIKHTEAQLSLVTSGQAFAQWWWMEAGPPADVWQGSEASAVVM